MDDVTRLAQSSHPSVPGSGGDVEKKLRAVWGGLTTGLQMGAVLMVNASMALLYLSVMLPLTLVGIALMQLCYQAPALIWRYDPLFEIMLDHWLLVLDEPVILGRYSLNPLFRKFDSQILQAMQIIWFNVTMTELREHLNHWVPGTDSVIPVAEAMEKLRAMQELLTGTLSHPENIPEAVGRMKDWMEDNPFQTVKTPEE